MEEFIVVYDKELKDVASIFEAILSKRTDNKALFICEKEYEGMKKIDKQRCIFIGKCSLHLKFTPYFDKGGVEFGWMGTKAWIRSNVNTDMAPWERTEFLQEYEMLLKKYEITGVKFPSAKSIDDYIKNEDKTDIWLFFPLINFAAMGKHIYRGNQIWIFLHLYGMLLFFDQYLQSFLRGLTIRRQDL